MREKKKERNQKDEWFASKGINIATNVIKTMTLATASDI